MNRQLRDYLPPIWLQARQMAVLAETEQPEVEQLWDGLQDGLDNQFLSTAGEYGISRWEAFLKIQPRGSETLDERRFRLQARLNERLPYTFLRLCEMLETLCGRPYRERTRFNREHHHHQGRCWPWQRGQYGGQRKIGCFRRYPDHGAHYPHKPCLRYGGKL